MAFGLHLKAETIRTTGDHSDRPNQILMAVSVRAQGPFAGRKDVAKKRVRCESSRSKPLLNVSGTNSREGDHCYIAKFRRERGQKLQAR